MTPSTTSCSRQATSSGSRVCAAKPARRARRNDLFRLGIVCEGDGDEAGLRQLLVRTEVIVASGIDIGRVFTANGRSNLTKPGGVERFFRYAALSHDAVLIVVDADKNCPVHIAQELAGHIRALGSALLGAVGDIADAVEAGRPGVTP